VKNLVYQYWLGIPGVAVEHGVHNMEQYAKRIGAEYQFKRNPTWANQYTDIPQYYNAFEVIWNPVFEEYDNILFADTDIFAVQDLSESIFDQDIADIGVCREEHKEISRSKGEGLFTSKHDKLWNSYLKNKYKVDMPLNDNGDMKIFNSGVVVYTRKGREKARKRFVKFREYTDLMAATSLPRFYRLDQNYLHANMIIADMDITEMYNGWNTQIHYTGDAKQDPRPIFDGRDDRVAKLCHVQLRNADNQDGDWHHTIVNKPKSEWRLK
jgi:lipopolysaccharide biosynthesis glycosyltransferase